MNDKVFDVTKYLSICCKLDCKVLMHGYEVFRGWMLEHTKLDVDNFTTIQSMASTFMLKPGCYDSVYQTPGVTQQYITRCVVGGRVVTNPNKQYHVKKKIADVDACSLYPSAMYFMEGFLQGLPQALKDTSYDFLKQQDGYFTRIRNIKPNRHLDFPLTSKLNEDGGVRNLTNDMENETMYVDKVGLGDLITYHEAEFEVPDGYYSNSGRNNRINDAIKDLHDLRKKLKRDKNPAQMVIKLLMNSMYGKTVIKPVETDTITKDAREYFEIYTSYNYNYIDSVLEVKGRWYIKKVKSIISHFNYVRCGLEILGMSKIIMNKVFSCAGENNKIKYQDTDNIHLNHHGVDKVVEIYKEEYGSELVGEELGNFHVYFDMDGADSEIYAIESLFLIKETYIDILESTDKDGKTINSEHIGMKGIPAPCIKYYA